MESDQPSKQLLALLARVHAKQPPSEKNPQDEEEAIARFIKAMRRESAYMDITISLPDDIAQRLREKHPDLARYVLECLALECYRSQIVGEEDVRRLLGFTSRFEVHALLKQRGVPLHDTLEDLEADGETHRRLGLSS